ncbi:hypothetical protein RhiirA1_405417, partial [Rhizophagus irregularis]
MNIDPNFVPEPIEEDTTTQPPDEANPVGSLLVVQMPSNVAPGQSYPLYDRLVEMDWKDRFPLPADRDNPEDEPQSFEDVAELYDKRPVDRTGYSLTLYTCTPGSSDPGGWFPYVQYQTADASENPKWYDPAQYKDIIIEKTDQETYDALIASGEMFKYDADNGYNSINGTPFDTR